MRKSLSTRFRNRHSGGHRLLVASVLAGCAPKKTYIPVVSKGLQHQFWQTVKPAPKPRPKQ